MKGILSRSLSHVSFARAEKVNAVIKLLKSSPMATDILDLIMLNIGGNVEKKFQPSFTGADKISCEK